MCGTYMMAETFNFMRKYACTRFYLLLYLMQYFFTGAAVLLNSLGGHAIAIEMMDAMEVPRHYTKAYVGGWLWTIFLIVPPSISINLAYQLTGAPNQVIICI